MPELEKVKEIKLLEHTREDVRRILTDYKLVANKETYSDWFSKFDAEIRIDYSEGKCSESDFDSFKVAEWKAVYILIEFNSPVKLEDLLIDLSKYKKEQKYLDIDDIYVYYDKENGIVFTFQRDKLKTIEFIPLPKYYRLMCDKDRAKKLSETTSIFANDLKDRRGKTSCPIANVEEIKLSQTDVVANCNWSDSTTGENCLNKSKPIDVLTVAPDYDGNSLIYKYSVSGGKIIGTGEKVLWDLSDVKPGTYTITAAVDDGCGFCGMTKTKIVTVKDCLDCKKP